jgi:hypothetical protein
MRASKLSIAAAVVLLGGTNLAIAAGAELGRNWLLFCRMNPHHFLCHHHHAVPEGAARGQAAPAPRR